MSPEERPAVPKERFHLLLADHTLRKLEALSGVSPTRPQWKTTFLHGTIAPDLLFYDPPFFKFTGVGRSLHRLMVPTRPDAIPDRLQDILTTPVGIRYRPWLLGAAHHFMVDLRWHPLINDYARLDGSPCRTLELNNRDCHHWLESELESYWLGRLGPSGGYLPLLKRFLKDVTWRMSMSGAYREFLTAAGLSPIPRVTEINRCAQRQIQLMIQFARPVWARIKGALLRSNLTKYIGALIVPQSPCPQGMISSGPAEPQRLWEIEFLNETVDSIATEFLSLPGWSWLSPTSQYPRDDTDRPVCPTTRNP